jgi:hypothetical protein
MTVKEFVEEYNKVKNNDKMRKNYLMSHIKRQYVPFLEKKVNSKKIIDLSYHIVINKNTIFKADSVDSYIFYKIKLVELYTDIDIVNDITDDYTIDKVYDDLNREGALEYLLMCIPEIELKEFQKIMELSMSDLYDNEYSTTAKLSNLLDSIKYISSAFNDVLEIASQENGDNKDE